MASTIGIKIANGDFFSIIGENSNVKKRLILTTVHDSQKSMQIDLYRSLMHTMADARYIGSIVVENIKPKPKGEPSIELIISSNENGELTASAVDLDSSAKAEHLHLSVSLKSLDVNSQEYDLPDFELDQNEPPPQGLYEKASLLRKREREKRKKAPWGIIIIAGLVIVLAALAFWFFLLRGGSTRAKPSSGPAVEQPARASEPAPAAEQPARTPEPAPMVTEQPAKAPEPVQVIDAAKPVESAPEPAASRTRQSAAPDSPYNVPEAIPKDGVVYRIRWGDTLWDISEAFYRNPWLYSRIARYNGIRNPDLIISGTTIRIPPKN